MTHSNISETENMTSQAESALAVFIPDIPEWVSVLYLVLLCLTIGLGIPGNLITVLAYFFHKEKTNCDWYIFYVALMDLLSCGTRGTGYLLEYLDVWVGMTSGGICKFTYWLSAISVYASTFIIGVVAVDRYSTICDVKRFKITVHMSRNVCLVASIVTALLSVPNLHLADNIPSRGVCQIKVELVTNKWATAYFSLIFIIFLVMMVAVVFCYANIILKVRSSRKIFSASNCVNQNANQSLDNTSGQNSLTSDIKLTTHTAIRSALSTSQNDAFLAGPSSSGKTNINRRLDQSNDGITISTSRDAHIIPPSSVSAKNSTERPERRRGLNSGISTFVSMTSDTQASRRLRRDYKITGLLFLVTFVFILSWIPPYASMVKGMFIGYNRTRYSLGEIILLRYGPHFYIINNFSNPLIYVALSSVYREKVLNLFTNLRRLYLRCRNFF